jgi:hypothetical protein
MELLRFYGGIIKLAFSHSVSLAQGVVFIAFIVVGIASRFAPNAVMNVGTWQVAALVFGSIVLIRLLLAPYWMAQERATRTALASADPVRTVERAYVEMSHTSPGLNPVNKRVEIEVKNTGRTPAKVMGVKLGYVIAGSNQPPPATPPYDQTNDHPGAQAFLHSESSFYVRRGLEIPASDWSEITAGQKTLYVIGLVEYVDAFEVWHRAGYARRYAHGRANNNLAFVTGGAYSYDIVISEAERLTGPHSDFAKG